MFRSLERLKTTMDTSALLDNLILHENDLTAEAKNCFGYHQEILHRFELNRDNVLDNKQLTPVGRHLLLAELDELYINCKHVLNYMATNNDILTQNFPINGPLIICGLPRTGTTLLYNLLACDPNCRAPFSTDMRIAPVPPISRSDSAEQEQRAIAASSAEQLRNKLLGQATLTSVSHPTFVVEEDFHIMEQVGISIPLTIMSSENQTELDAWTYNSTNKDFVYDYHKTFLRMLNSVDAPRSYWLLKSPEHALYINTLYHHYPKAALIMTHRHLDEVVPSLCSLTRIFGNIYLKEADLSHSNTLTKRTLRHIDKIIEHIVEFRTRPIHNQSHKNILDILYNDLILHPIITVRYIYDHFGFKWSDEFEMAMQTWLHDNPQGKQGRHIYNLDQFGLTKEYIELRYSDYINMFLHSSSLLDLSAKMII